MTLNDFSKQLTDLHRISLDLSKTKTFDELCRRAIELGINELGFERLSFWYVDKKDRSFLKGSYGTDENGKIRDEREIRIPFSSLDLSFGLLTGEVFIEYKQDALLYNHDGLPIGKGDIAIAGLWDGNKYIGCVQADNLLTGKKILKSQRDLLLIYGRTLGNISSLKLAEEELKEHSRFEKILKEITKVSIEQTDLNEMIYTLENLLRHLFCGKYSRIYMQNDYISPLFDYSDWERDLFEKYCHLNEKLILSNVGGFPSVLLLPVSNSKNQKGLILIVFEKAHVFYNDEIERGEQAVWQISLALEKAQLFEETVKLSTIDELTGINNRRHFFQLAERELIRSVRKKTDLSVIMLDIDYFKKINDTYGHQSGDIVLKSVADKLQEGLREVDILGRYGGEEFAIVLPDTDQDKAILVVERLLLLIRSMKNPLTESDISISISGGISMISRKKPQLKTMLEEADKALYIAKEQGRDRYVTYSDK